jgi:phage shock protein PspC (stress-responsive transcriptional regulator)
MEPEEQPTANDPHPPVRRLYRSPTDRQLGGVCRGIAEYTATDPTLIRVLFIVLAVMGPGLLLYPLLWIFVPEGPQPAPRAEEPRATPGEAVPAA